MPSPVHSIFHAAYAVGVLSTAGFPARVARGMRTQSSLVFSTAHARLPGSRAARGSASYQAEDGVPSRLPPFTTVMGLPHLPLAVSPLTMVTCLRLLRRRLRPPRVQPLVLSLTRYLRTEATYQISLVQSRFSSSRALDHVRPLAVLARGGSVLVIILCFVRRRSVCTL